MTETVAAVAVVVAVAVAVAVIVAVTASDEIIGRHIHLGGPNPPEFYRGGPGPLTTVNFPLLMGRVHV